MSDLKTELNFLDGALEPQSRREFLRYHGDSDWVVNGSGITDYSIRANFFGRRTGLLKILETNLPIGVDGRVGLDIAAGSAATALLDLVQERVVARGLATNYEDSRPADLRADGRIDHVDGDLTETSTWEKILAWREEHAPQGFAVVMHRPVGGLQRLQPDFYRGAVHTVLDMVSEGGIFFTQIPDDLMGHPNILEGVCRGISERDDVREIIKGEPLKSHSVNDSHSYAAILKN